jgi:hypothetical protein
MYETAIHKTKEWRDRSTDQIARLAEALDWPTEGKFAEAIFRISTEVYPHDKAAEMMRDAGYIPLVGYPLTRSGKLPTMTRQEVEEELASDIGRMYNT